MTAACINDIGLLLDIIGAILLFKFGLPASIDRNGHTHFVVKGINEEEVKRGKLYDKWAKVGLSLLILGFTFQLLSNHL